MSFISEYKAIIILVAILIGLGVITSMIKSIKRKAKRAANRIVNNAINRATSRVLGAGINMNDVSKLINATKEAADEPEKKSVFGATNLYLPKIEKDFADFHNMEAISAIKIFINEYLDIKYGEKQHFSNSNVEPGLETMINIESNRISTSNVTIHNTAISNYIKTNEYATITYQVAVGYNVNENLAFGLALEYSDFDNDVCQYGIQPYARYTFYRNADTTVVVSPKYQHIKRYDNIAEFKNDSNDFSSFTGVDGNNMWTIIDGIPQFKHYVNETTITLKDSGGNVVTDIDTVNADYTLNVKPVAGSVTDVVLSSESEYITIEGNTITAISLPISEEKV